MESSVPVLEMKHITKSFDGKLANDNISLVVNEGEIVALLGENGAGKSTLMNVLFGLYKADSGEIFIDGEKANIESPLDAIEAGIGMVHQHFMLVSAFSTYENIALSIAGHQNGIIDSKTLRAQIAKRSEQYDLNVPVDMITEDLSVGMQQQVEILKALFRDCKILVLDEPTGVLNEQEKTKLFESLKSMKKAGMSIIFISHKLDEVLEISDKVVILSQGKRVDTVKTSETTKEDLAKRMVGRDVVFSISKEEHLDLKEKEIVLELKNLNVEGRRLASTIKDLSLTVHKGEIFGIAGVDGNGQSELIEAISGLRHVSSGGIWLDGSDVTNAKVQDVKCKGLSLIPEDRRGVGTVGTYNLDQNILLRCCELEKFHKSAGRINQSKLHENSDELIEEFDIRIPNRNMPVGQLSGGNIQKVILAREISSEPSVLLCMHPTRGLDVGAIEFVRARLVELADQGCGIVLVSTELEEIIFLADRMAVMSNGRLSKPFAPHERSTEEIGLLLGGIESEGANE